MINFKKFWTRRLLSFPKANYFDISRGLNKLSDQKLKDLVQNESKDFSNWLTKRVLEGKGTNFKFSDISENLRLSLDSVSGSVDNRLEEREVNWQVIKNNPVRIFNEILDSQGTIDNKTINKIAEMHAEVFRHKKIYESPEDAVDAIKLFSSQPDIIIMEIVLNLDYGREDHLIPNSVIKLPFESTITNDICVITSDTNFELAKACGAMTVMSAAGLASALEEKTLHQKKLIATEDQYTDLIDYCKDGLTQLGIQIPTRENGNLIPNGDLKSVLIFLSTNHIHLKIMKRSSEYIPGSKYFNKIIQLEIGDSTMEKDHILKNIDYVLKNISNKKPESIEGRYFLTAVLIVKNKVFNIQPQSLDPRLESYKWGARLLN
jgi:ribosomal protein L1